MSTNRFQDLSTIRRCLAIPEIFGLICRQVQLEGFRMQEDMSALAALARTCRAWSDIALDNLWHTIFGISCLVRCMPQDLWYSERAVLTLRRPLMASDIRVLRKYASRVRVLDHKYHPGSRVQAHASIYQVLLLSSYDCLLPKLEELRWAPKSGANISHFIRLFLSPRLKVLDITFDPDHTEHLGLLDIIPTIFCPHISKLNIHNLTPRLAELIPSSLSAWSSLTNLHMEDITLNDLVYIAELPALEHLTFDELSSMWTPQTSKATTGTQLLESLHTIERPFSSLKALTMRIYIPIGEVARLFKLFRDIKLAQLNIGLRYMTDTLNGLSEFIETVARNCQVGSLRNFKLFYPIFDNVTFSTALHPLLKFHALECVDIQGFFTMSFTDEEAIGIALSLPNIRSLSLPSRAQFVDFSLRDSDHPLPTLLSLLAFAKCTELRYLSLEIDASDEAARHELQKKLGKTRIRNYSLRTLSVGWSPISHKEFVAFFLSDVFPNLRDVNSSSGMDRGDEPRYRQWQHIGQILLPMFGWMREKEYERMGVRNTRYSPWIGSARWYNDTMEDEDGDWLDGGETGSSLGYHRSG